jgi:D-xylose 1-dehydrogenase (NADP+, D-xylono-1,5-lactone-forming)
MNGDVRWGFLGAGGIATTALAPAIHAASGAALEAVAARDPARGGALGPSGRAYDDYAALLDDDRVEAVYISLPNAAHLPWTLRALAAGKHVLCEKPLGGTAAEVDRMTAAAGAAGRLLVEATWYRWHPRTRRALELLDEVGPARHVRADFCFGNVPAGDFRLDPACGGGALADVGCYAVSAAAAFLRVEGSATGSAAGLAVERADVRLGPTGVDLAAEATLVGGTGRAVARCGIDEIERQGVVVDCDGGTLELVAPPFTSWHDPALLRVVSDGRERVERFDDVDAYRVMVQAVSARIRGDDAWVLPLAESRLVARTLDAIRSADPAVVPHEPPSGR